MRFHFDLVYGQSLITVSVKYPEMKLITGVISLRSFWQKWNFNSRDKWYENTSLKWNHPIGHICACEYFINTNIVDQIIKIKNNAMKTNANTIFFHGET